MSDPWGSTPRFPSFHAFLLFFFFFPPAKLLSTSVLSISSPTNCCSAVTSGAVRSVHEAVHGDSLGRASLHASNCYLRNFFFSPLPRQKKFYFRNRLVWHNSPPRLVQFGRHCQLLFFFFFFSRYYFYPLLLWDFKTIQYIRTLFVMLSVFAFLCLFVNYLSIFGLVSSYSGPTILSVGFSLSLSLSLSLLSLIHI